MYETFIYRVMAMLNNHQYDWLAFSV